MAVHRFLLLCLLVFLLLAVSLTPLAAQEALPTDTPGDDTLTAVEPLPEPPAGNPAFAAMLAIAASVFTFIELLKPYIDFAQKRYGWNDEVHKLVVRLVTTLVALAVVFLTPNAANFIPAFGFTLNMPTWLAQVITALFISGNATLLWAVYRLVKLLPPTTLAAVLTPGVYGPPAVASASVTTVSAPARSGPDYSPYNGGEPARPPDTRIL